MKKRHRIATLCLAVVFALCLIVPTASAARAETFAPTALATLVADLSYSGSGLYLYGRGATTNTDTIYYTVALQQKSIWPGAQFADYQAFSGSDASGSFVFGTDAMPPFGYHYRVAAYASGAGFSDMVAYSDSVFF